MTKPTSETVHDFNEMVNMTPEELEEWLESAFLHHSLSLVHPMEELGLLMEDHPLPSSRRQQDDRLAEPLVSCRSW
jgi:hypothetical protein